MCNQCPTVGDLFSWVFRCCSCKPQCKPTCKPSCVCQCKPVSNFGCPCSVNNNSNNQANGCLNGACGIY